MEILRKKLTRAEFAEYMKTKTFGSVKPNEIVIHHTWRPTVADWDGERTVDGLKRYYEGQGWEAGPHIFVGPDGIWLFTDMAEVGIHAGAGNATWIQNGKELQGYTFKNAKLKSYSIGIEVVGDYDEQVWDGEVKLNALSCISTLQKYLQISFDQMFFHRDFSTKTCPGKAITRDWLKTELGNFQLNNSEANGYEFQFSPHEAKRAMDLGLLKRIDSSERELLGIGLVRLYDKIQKEFRRRDE